MSPFGSMISAGMPASSASSSRTIASPVLPEPVIPTMTPCVVRSLEPIDEIVRPRLARRGIDDLAEVRTSRDLPWRRVYDNATGVESADDRPRSGSPRAPSRSSRSATPATSSGSAARSTRSGRLDELAREAREAPAAPVRRGPAQPSCSSSRGSTPPARTASSGRSSRASTRRAAGSPRSRRRPRPSSRTTTSGACTPPCRPAARSGSSTARTTRTSSRCGCSSSPRRRCGSDVRGHIVEWERMLVDEGTTIVKVFLNVSKEEQRPRLQERIDDPEKRWKFRKDDLDGARALRRVRRRLRRRDRADVDRARAVVRRPGRPQLGQGDRRRRAARRCARAASTRSCPSRRKASRGSWSSERPRPKTGLGPPSPITLGENREHERRRAAVPQQCRPPR